MKDNKSRLLLATIQSFLQDANTISETVISINGRSLRLFIINNAIVGNFLGEDNVLVASEVWPLLSDIEYSNLQNVVIGIPDIELEMNNYAENLGFQALDKINGFA